MSEVHDTSEDRAPIIDGLGRAPPRPHAAGHLIAERSEATNLDDGSPILS